MENCENILDLLNAYIDGELDENEAMRVRAHIDGCEDCRKAYGELVRVNELITYSAAEAPETLLGGVLEKISKEKRGKIINLRKISSIAAAAVVVLAVVSSPLIGRIANGGAAKEECADNAVALAPSVEQKGEIFYSGTGFEKFDGVLDAVEDILAPAETEAAYAEPEIAITVVFGVEYKVEALNGEGFTVVFDGEIAIFNGEKYEYKQLDDKYVLSSGNEFIYLRACQSGESLWFELTEGEND